MKFYLDSYGCTANKADACQLGSALKSLGLDPSPDPESADLIILYTCVVTQRTQLDMLKLIQRYRSLNKRLILAGCLPGALSQGVLDRDELAGCEYISPTSPQTIYSLLGIHGPPILDFPPEPMGKIGALRICDGCLGKCSYCIVRLIRGNLRSFPPQRLVDWARYLIQRGVKEIQLTAQDTAAYGADLGTNLVELLSSLVELEGDFMIRIGMMNPSTASKIFDDLLDIYSHPKIYKFLHLPVQSGSDKVLREMNRGHTLDQFLELVRKFRSRFPDSTLSTDFIIGYPTETHSDFQDSLRLLEQIRSTKVNITRFSPRPGTPAAKLKPLPGWIVKSRSRIFTLRSKEIALQENMKQLGRVVRALAILPGKPGSFVARDKAYRYILIKSQLELGEWYCVKILRANPNYLEAKVY